VYGLGGHPARFTFPWSNAAALRLVCLLLMPAKPRLPPARKFRKLGPQPPESMPNPEHLAILKQGVEAWNQWRQENAGIEPNLTFADGNKLDLTRADLHRADLRNARLTLAKLVGVNLSDAFLGGSDLFGADLTNANLKNADLRFADLSEVHFDFADLTDTKLSMANLTKANLAGANFSRATLGWTILANLDLSEVIGLETVQHEGPSTIGIDSFFRSEGKIPDVFLCGAGVPDIFIQYAASLAGTAFEFYSCFISYSTKDDALVQRLYADLQGKGVRCWLFPEDAKWGESVWGEIDKGIKLYDKLLVVCSRRSLQSPPVLREIERALQREDKEKRNILFPVRVDNYVLKGWEHERKADVVKKIIGDFRKWKDHDAYAKAFERLLRDLKSEKVKAVT
jgi:uncharacterized protein YjbI with pentapeptide repeats